MADDQIGILVEKFRNLFPDTSRKSLTQEFTKLVHYAHYDNRKQGLRTPLSPLEFRVSLSKSKPDFLGLFTEEEFNLVFRFFDPENSQKIALFEFVKGIRVSVVYESIFFSA